MSDLLSIGTVAAQARVATSTLRYYDDIGVVRPATRIGGRRRYNPDVLRRLRIIDLCQQAGFTLEEIASLLDGRGDLQRLAADKLNELDGRINQLKAARRLVEAALACGCAHLESCGRAGHADSNQICGEPR